MTTTRLEFVMQRNQKSALFDLLLALLFLLAASATGVAMKGAIGQLAGIPVAIGGGERQLRLASPCQPPGAPASIDPIS